MPRTIEVCILAAGLGKRMKSDKPKVLQTIGGEPMLSHQLRALGSIAPAKIHVVVGRGAELVKEAFAHVDVNWVYQSEQKGTGHAVMEAMPQVDPTSVLLILLGDAPLITPDTLKRMVDAPCDLGVLTADVTNPFNYGRIVRSVGDEIAAIVEERDCTDEQRAIREINTGVMVSHAKHIKQWLTHIDTDNKQQEYLLTDIVKVAAGEGASVTAIKADDPNEVLGVNNFAQLAVLEREYQRRVANRLMMEGVRIIDPDRIDVRGQLHVGQGSTIDINCVFEGACDIGENARIGPNCVIRNATIGDNVEIKPNSTIDEAVIGDDCSVGPFARIRPGTELARDVHIGNFVEVKKSRIGEGTKASHLTYLGDAVIGTNVNVGAGTITCNYDGVNKHETNIGDNVFVGSNTALVAPITISDNSWIAAGSTITRDVAEGHLSIARGRQRDIEGWQGPAAKPKKQEEKQ